MKKSLLSIGIVVLIIALLVFAVFFGLNLGLVEIDPLRDGISLGLDLVGGSEITYEAIVPDTMSDAELKQAMEAVQSMLRQRLNSMGYTEGVVVLSGDRGVNVSIPNVSRRSRCWVLPPSSSSGITPGRSSSPVRTSNRPRPPICPRAPAACTSISFP